MNVYLIFEIGFSINEKEKKVYFHGFHHLFMTRVLFKSFPINIETFLWDLSENEIVVIVIF